MSYDQKAAEWTNRLTACLIAVVGIVAILSIRACHVADVERAKECDRSGGTMINEACIHTAGAAK